jgi:hypothetical protein
MRKIDSKFIFLLFFLVLTIIPDFCFSFDVDPNHPRIFINSGNIETIKARCGVANHLHSEYQTHLSEYNNVKDAANRYSEAQILGFDPLNQARMTLANTFVYLMGGGASYYNKAKIMLDQISSLGRDDKSHYGFFTACIIYDWLYNTLSAAEKSGYASDIVQYVITDSYYSQYNTFDAYYHARKYTTSIFAVSGQAVHNEDPANATEFINRSIAVFNRMMEVQNEVAEDGFIYPLGQSGYFDESSWMPTLRVLAGLKFAGISGAEIDALDFTSIAKTAYGEIYALIKDNYLVAHNDLIKREAELKPWAYARSPEGPFYSAILAKLFEGQEIGKITNYLQSNYLKSNTSEKPFHYLGSILFNNKIVNSVGSTITSLPLTKMFDDTVLIYRSGWNGLKSDNKEVLFNYMAEKHVNGHTHYAKGHFDIWRGYDPLTFTSGNYSATAHTHYLYFGDSLAHNNLLIRNPSEDTSSRPNDGGQLSNHGEGGDMSPSKHDSSAWREVGHTNEGERTYTGRIKRFSFSDDYFYVYHHYPTAYSANKLNDLSRSVVKIGDYFIVLDRIDGVNASFTKRWLLHSIGIPTIVDAGSWNGGTALDGNGGTPNQTSDNTQLLKVSEGDSSLFINSIFPLNKIIHRVGGSADYRWYSYNENTNYSQSAPSDGRYGDWRIEIESSMNTEDDVFLTVLYPTSISGSIANTTALSGTNYNGVTIDDVTARAVIFSSSVDESSKQDSYTFTINSPSNLQMLVCDLVEGSYQINKDGSLLSKTTVSSDSTLSFETSSGGDFEVLKIPSAPKNLRIKQ